MREDFSLFQAAGTHIVVIARHSPDQMREYWEKHHLPYIGVPDLNGSLGNLYGQKWHLLKLGLMPAQFIISTSMQIVYAHYSSSMADIPKNKTILDELQSLNL